MDVAELVGSGLRTPDDAWRFIAELFAGFGRPVTDADGYTADELAAAPVPLPAAVAGFTDGSAGASSSRKEVPGHGR